MTAFKDHFSGHAGDYSRHRPGYPAGLFAWLASLAPSHKLAWDAGCGNGQVAGGLARHFGTVYATDASQQQVASAIPYGRVSYHVEPAEQCSLGEDVAGLVTVGQALHWFNLDGFYREVKRVLVPGGVIAAWTYQLCVVSPEVDRVVETLYEDIAGSYWPPERRHVENAYLDLQFPFEEFETPGFTLEMSMDLSAYRGYLRTWSSVRRYEADRGEDPVSFIDRELAEAWGCEEKREVKWPISMRAGRTSD